LLKALGLPIWKVPRLMREMRARMAAEVARFTLFPGVPECLQRLAKGGVRLGIVSSNSRENVQRILGSELGKLIHHYDCGASMFGKTPKVRRVTRLSQTASGIYIGDEVRDAEASREAGLSFGAVTWGHHRIEVLQTYRPDEVFHQPLDIADRILL
jgi:phosphoglycolate phosphatase